ncbi:MAG: hypothetical protein IKV43_05365, partial [Clostridia bacterium]|nr:hypothetical protein [Clostridia bacterium]
MQKNSQIMPFMITKPHNSAFENRQKRKRAPLRVPFTVYRNICAVCYMIYAVYRNIGDVLSRRESVVGIDVIEIFHNLALFIRIIAEYEA